MMLPGLVSFAFYRRRPTGAQVAMGVIVTVAASSALGYISPGGPLGQLGSVVVAVVGGLAIYFGILFYLTTRYQRRRSPVDHATSSSASQEP